MIILTKTYKQLVTARYIFLLLFVMIFSSSQAKAGDEGSPLDSIKINGYPIKNIKYKYLYKFRIGDNIAWSKDTTLKNWLTYSGPFDSTNTDKIKNYWSAYEILIPKELFNKPIYLQFPSKDICQVWQNNILVYDFTNSAKEKIEIKKLNDYLPYSFSQEKNLIFYRILEKEEEISVSYFGKYAISHFAYITGVNENHTTSSTQLSICIFFSTVAFIYILLFFIGGRELKYFLGALFTLSIATFFFLISLPKLDGIYLALLPVFNLISVPLFLLLFINSFFQFKLHKILKYILISLLAVFTVCSVLMINKKTNDLVELTVGISLFIFLITCCVLIIISTIKAVKRKLNNSSIILFGIIGLLSFSLFLLIGVLFTDIEFIHTNWYKVITMLPLPLSILIALVRDYALSNKNLSLQLVKVEELTALTIKEQEEKQLILSKQNEILEHQVTERTREITEQKHLIEEKNREITDSINYAQKIQGTLMASDKLLNDNLKGNTQSDYFILNKPKDIVSGDFYWAHKYNNEFVLVTADCTGHGVPGAFMSLLCVSYLNEIVKEQHITQPDSIFNAVREKIVTNFKGNEKSERKDGMDAVAYKINADKSTLEYSAANNSIILIEPNADGTFELSELKADKMPVGVSHDNSFHPFTLGKIDLKKGTLLYSFSDGYADQFGGPKGKKFMYKQMRELFLSIAHLPMHEQKQKLDSAIENWKGNTEQVDDILIIGVRV